MESAFILFLRYAPNKSKTIFSKLQDEQLKNLDKCTTTNGGCRKVARMAKSFITLIKVSLETGGDTPVCRYGWRD